MLVKQVILAELDSYRIQHSEKLASAGSSNENEDALLTD